MYGRTAGRRKAAHTAAKTAAKEMKKKMSAAMRTGFARKQAQAAQVTEYSGPARIPAKTPASSMPTSPISRITF